MKNFGLLVALLTCSSVAAQEYSIQCSVECQDPAAEAWDFAASQDLDTSSIVNVIQVDDFKAKTYAVSARVSDSLNNTYKVSSVPTSKLSLERIADMKAVLDTMQSFAVNFEDNGTVSNLCEGPNAVVDSGEDLVRCRQAQTALLNKVFNGSYGYEFQAASSMIDTLREALNWHDLEINLPLEVALADGSEIDFSFFYSASPRGQTITDYKINFGNPSDAKPTQVSTR